MNPETSFGALIKSRRNALGMTQAALAELVGRSASSIRSWERNSSTPSDETVVQSLSAVLGIDEDDLREAVGLPPNMQVDSETVGGATLEAFAGEAEHATAETMSADEIEAPLAGVAPIDEQPEVEEPSATEADMVAEAEPRAAVPAVAEPPIDEPTEVPDEELEPEAAADSGGEVDEAIIDADMPGAVPAEDDEVAPESPEELVREPADEAGEAVALPTVSESEATVVEPVTSGVASARSARTQVAEQPPAPVPRSYLEDPDQMMTYWIRAVLTVALTVFLIIVLFWALGRLGDSLGEVWEIFKSGA